MKRLANKTCLITAAGQGIGRETAETFIRAGAQVYATDIDINKVKDIEGATACVLDVTDTASVQDIHERIGRLDVLFNCAGFVHAGSILECSDDDWDLAFDLNVKGMYRTIRTFLPAMLAHGAGSIINMSSVASSLKGVPNRFAYTTSKAAVIGLTKSVAADYVAQGIRCNAICPGTVDSPSLHDRLRATGDYDQAMKDFIARQPMKRLGASKEIAELALYLASDDSSFTTGQCHIIDGGWAI